MERISRKDIEEKLRYGAMIYEKDISVLGFDGKMHFEIYDGFAYCPNFKGKEYCMKYPKLEFIEESKEMQEEIRDYLNYDNDEVISVLDVIQSFNEMAEDGVRITYDNATKTYKAKVLWLVIEEL